MNNAICLAYRINILKQPSTFLGQECMSMILYICAMYQTCYLHHSRKFYDFYTLLCMSRMNRSKQGRPQDFGLGAKSLARSAKKRFARSAKKILNFAPRKTYFCPPKINFLPYYFLVWNYFGGGHAPPQNQLWGGPWPPLPPPLWTQ